MTRDLARTVAELVGREVTSTRSAGSVTRVSLDDGTEAIAKSGPADAIAAEAAGLRWLAEPGTVGVPAVLGASPETQRSGARPSEPETQRSEARPSEPEAQRSAARPSEPSLLVTEAVSSGRATAKAATAFGRGLAGMHAAGAPAFGAPPPGGPVDAWIGGARMRNEIGDAWPEWYAEHRVLPYAREAFSGHDLELVERACSRLPEVAGPPEPPSRLHGDLWTGNVLWSSGADGAGTAWIIDPAAHGGHRETDLAMLALFGCPHLDTILEAYDAVAPLADGWRDRVPMHQLWPLLVHTVLFGSSYAGQALGVCKQVLAAPRPGR